MTKNKLMYGIGVIIIAIIISVIAISYKNIQPSATDLDIAIEGVLEPNNTGIYEYKEYLLSIKMTKKKDCDIAIYPYIDGLGYMSFSDKDSEGYYVPGSIGSDGVTEPIAVRELQGKNMIENDVDLVGFWFPEEAGQYKARVYFDTIDTSYKGSKNPVLVCVYTERRYGKDLTWSKVVPITIQ